MEISRIIELSKIDEIRILSNVRLVHSHDLNPIYSKENLQTQFAVTGDVKGAVNCYLCLDDEDISPSDKNFIFPLFVEAMNILIGKQISLDPQLSLYKIKLSPPKLSMISKEINSAHKSTIQVYELELDGFNLQILIEYSLEALN